MVLLPVIGLMMPLVSAYFVAIFVRNDRTIGLLAAFNAALEESSERVGSGSILPRWFAGGAETWQERWMQLALENRRWANYATLALSAMSPITTAIDLILILSNDTSVIPGLQQRGWLTLISIIFAAFIVIILWKQLYGLIQFRDLEVSGYRYDWKKREIFLKKNK